MRISDWSSDVCSSDLHVFFAEREASKIPKLADSLALRTVASVGIVGAGTMGIGIAMSFASAGISVVLHDLSAESLTRAAETIRKTYDAPAAKGGLRAEEAERFCVLIRTDARSEGRRVGKRVVD